MAKPILPKRPYLPETSHPFELLQMVRPARCKWCGKDRAAAVHNG